MIRGSLSSEPRQGKTRQADDMPHYTRRITWETDLREVWRLRVSRDNLIQSVMKLSDWFSSETVTAGLKED